MSLDRERPAQMEKELVYELLDGMVDQGIPAGQMWLAAPFVREFLEVDQTTAIAIVDEWKDRRVTA